MERRVEGVVGKVRVVEGMVEEVKERVEKLAARVGVEIDDKLREATIQVEGKLSAVCGSELGVLSGKVGELQERIRDVEAEVDSRVAVGEGRCEEKIGVLERTVDEVRDGLHAIGVKVEDLSGDWVLVENKKKKERSVSDGPKKTEVGFGELCKSKAKDTVVVIGDSLVRGVGQKLEQQCPHMVTSVSRSGAKLEVIEADVARLKDREDRHLVVMVGTNNIQRDGSEVILKKFKNLIKLCKSVRNRAVTIVGIPKRYDVDNIVESRRLGVNPRLAEMCRENGVEFLACEVERSRMWRDGVHFNDLGQDEFARKLFTHCIRFLD